MTEADELRRLLDERNVKWTSERVSNGVLFTFAKDGRTYSVFVRDRAGLEIWSQYLTPAQAISATLGTGTCRNVRPDRNSFKCSECGGAWYGVGGNAIARPYPKYCPNCAARIVEVDG